jgi:hypothetical protein
MILHTALKSAAEYAAEVENRFTNRRLRITMTIEPDGVLVRVREAQPSSSKEKTIDRVVPWYLLTYLQFDAFRLAIDELVRQVVRGV